MTGYYTGPGGGGWGGGGGFCHVYPTALPTSSYVKVNSGVG